MTALVILAVFFQPENQSFSSQSVEFEPEKTGLHLIKRRVSIREFDFDCDPRLP